MVMYRLVQNMNLPSTPPERNAAEPRAIEIRGWWRRWRLSGCYQNSCGGASGRGSRYVNGEVDKIGL